MAETLGLKERRFVDAYLGTTRGNATQAARQAGYSGSSEVLKVQGSRLLTRANVRALIDRRLQAETRTAVLAAGERDVLLSNIARSSKVPVRDRIRDLGVEQVHWEALDSASAVGQDHARAGHGGVEEDHRKPYSVTFVGPDVGSVPILQHDPCGQRNAQRPPARRVDAAGTCGWIARSCSQGNGWRVELLQSAERGVLFDGRGRGPALLFSLGAGEVGAAYPTTPTGLFR